MTRNIVIAIIMCVAVAATMACNKLTANTMTQPNPKIEKTDVVKSFRYEYYEGKKSEVYYYNNSDTHSSFYTRDFGSSTGWNYTVNDKPVASLTALAQELKLDSYPYTDLNDEKKRDRWIIEVNYTNGKHVSIVSYLKDNTEKVNADIRTKAEAAFKGIVIKDENGKMMGEYSRSEYEDGKFVREINYTRDGIVCGGHDVKKPGAVF